MIKLLHSGDWHLDAPQTRRSQEEQAHLRREALLLPGKIAQLCRAQGCQMMLLSGDLFDGNYSQESLRAVYAALEEAAVPVFIAPGNHDFCSQNSPWIRENWPENVHIFTNATIESVYLADLDCRIYGAGYQSMDCPPLLQGFRAREDARYHIGLVHGDPLTPGSPNNPITAGQIKSSGLQYLALGHIHKDGKLRQGNTLCAWPGCPMGQGFDELGPKGVYIVTVEESAQAEFLPLDTPRFFQLSVPAGVDPLAAVENALPAGESLDFYRICLTGEADKPDLDALRKALDRFPHLTLLDETVPVLDLWGSADSDSLEGVYFRLLRKALEEDEAAATLAARISRQILSGQEVVLP